MTEEPLRRGRLAQVIASRGGLAPPEAPFVIEHREALIYMLCQAAELEHGIMCQYLYAAFSLKQSEDEGLTAEEATGRPDDGASRSRTWPPRRCCTCRWCRTCCPPSARPRTCPGRTSRSPPATTRPACTWRCCRSARQALRHFMFLERPEGMDLAGRGRDGRLRRARPGHAARRDRPARPGLRHRRAPVPVDRGRDRAPGREVRRAVAVRRPAAGAGHPAVLRLAGAGRGHRRGLGAAGHRRDPGAGRRPARALAETRTSASSSRSWTSTRSSARPTRPSTRPGRWSRSTSGRRARHRTSRWSPTR